MKKEELIKIAQDFCAKQAQVYPTQDYHLHPNGNEYGFPAPYPFPDHKGVGCLFDSNGDCMYVCVKTSLNNYLGGTKIETTKWSSNPSFMVSLILEGDSEEKLSLLQKDLKQEIIHRAKPIDNK